MQLHKLAPVVFIESGAGFTRLARIRGYCGRRLRSHAQPVIEIKKHGGTLRGRDQQVFEFAESMGADDVAFISRDQVLVGVLIEVHVEMIEPEIGHHLLQLPFAIESAQKLSLLQFVDHNIDRPVRGEEIFALLGR